MIKVDPTKPANLLCVFFRLVWIPPKNATRFRCFKDMSALDLGVGLSPQRANVEIMDFIDFDF